MRWKSLRVPTKHSLMLFALPSLTHSPPDKCTIKYIARPKFLSWNYCAPRDGEGAGDGVGGGLSRCRPKLPLKKPQESAREDYRSL